MLRWLPQPLALLRESRVSRNVVPFSGRAWWRGGVEAEGTQQRGGRSGGRIVGADGEQLAGMRGGKVRLWRKVAWRTRPERQGFLPWSRGGVPRGPALPRRGGAALGCVGAAKDLRRGTQRRSSPRRGGASVGLAREGSSAGRFGPGGHFGRSPLRRWFGQGRAAYSSGQFVSAVAQCCPQRGAPPGEAPLSLALSWCEGAGGFSRIGGGWAPQRKPGRPLQGGRA